MIHLIFWLTISFSITFFSWFLFVAQYSDQYNSHQCPITCSLTSWKKLFLVHHSIHSRLSPFQPTTLSPLRHKWKVSEINNLKEMKALLINYILFIELHQLVSLRVLFCLKSQDNAQLSASSSLEILYSMVCVQHDSLYYNVASSPLSDNIKQCRNNSIPENELWKCRRCRNWNFYSEVRIIRHQMNHTGLLPLLLSQS